MNQLNLFPNDNGEEETKPKSIKYDFMQMGIMPTEGVKLPKLSSKERKELEEIAEDWIISMGGKPDMRDLPEIKLPTQSDNNYITKITGLSSVEITKIETTILEYGAFQGQIKYREITGERDKFRGQRVIENIIQDMKDKGKYPTNPLTNNPYAKSNNY